MIKEFPNLKERKRQKAFLADWWSGRKLARGKRHSGKTTMMLCEARRFAECGFDILFLTENMHMSENARRAYHDLFGEHPPFDFGSYEGTFRGFHKDVIVCDEFQEIDLQTFNQEIMPMSPSFIRAAACESTMNSVHYLADEGGEGFFDSVYEV